MRTTKMKTISTLAITFALGAVLAGCSQETTDTVEHTAKDSYENVEKSAEAFGTEMEKMGDHVESKASELQEKAAEAGNDAADTFNQGANDVKDSSKAAMEEVQKKANDMTPDES